MSEVKNGAIEGPDLNSSKMPLDRKVYRQILLPNGMRAVLISDTVAMQQSPGEAKSAEEDGKEGEEEEGEEDGMDEDEDDMNEEGEEGDMHSTRDAAAALLVGAGSFYDPADCQGLAHFLEHLLFMGSEKYPGENDYDSYLSQNGGYSNAYTECEYTVFNFSVPQEYLFGALDRLAQFFIAPLLLQSGVDRELKAIESEFQLSKNSDQCRLHQIWSTTSQNPDHPFSQFHWGNLKSLKEIPEKNHIDTIQRLREFYDEHYFACNMRLAVVGAYSLDELQHSVEESYGSIPSLPRLGSLSSSNHQSLISWESVPQSVLTKYGLPIAPSRPQIYRIIPVKDRHSLAITWQLPSQVKKWQQKPCDYIANLLGHEGSGSLLSALKKKSWVTTCVAGVGSGGLENASSHSLFNVAFTLTLEGVNQWHNVVSYIYRYIGMLRNYGNDFPEWIYEELRLMQEVAYRYGDESSPEDTVDLLAECMAPHFNLPPERLLDGNHLLFEYDPNEIQNLLNYLIPSNARIDFMSSQFGRSSDFENSNLEVTGEVLKPSIIFDKAAAGVPRVEPWFGALYWIQDLDPSVVKEWTDLVKPQVPAPEFLLSLPSKNPFVPTRLDLKKVPLDDIDHPILNAPLEFCIVGEEEWIRVSVIQYNSLNNKVLVLYQNEETKWHSVDVDASEYTSSILKPGFEGYFDNKQTKFRVVSQSLDHKGTMPDPGESHSDDVDEENVFPIIPPAKLASRLPKLICETSLLKLWHLQDRTFHRPSAQLLLILHAPKVNTSPLHRVCAELLVTLCIDALTETVYMASLCGLGSSIESSELGFACSAQGFDDKLVELFTVLFRIVLSFRGRQDSLPPEIADGRFENCLEILQRKYENTNMEALKLVSNTRIRCLCAGVKSSFDKANAIKDLNVATFCKVVSEFLDEVGAEGFLHGNIDEADANAAMSALIKVMESAGCKALAPDMRYCQQVAQVPVIGQNPTEVILPSRDSEESNTAVEAYFQVGPDNLLDRVLVDVLAQIMSEPLFDQVRTKDQFGYRVSCDSRWTSGVIGFQILIVTSSKSASATTERIDRFLRDFRKDLEEMSAQKFKKHIIALAKEKLEMFSSLSEETSNLWAEIRDGRYDWEVRRNEAICLRTVTKEQVLAAFDRLLNPGKERRSFVVKVICNPNGDESRKEASSGRPEVSAESIGAYIDNSIREFHSKCQDTWGKIALCNK